MAAPLLSRFSRFMVRLPPPPMLLCSPPTPSIRGGIEKGIALTGAARSDPHFCGGGGCNHSPHPMRWKEHPFFSWVSSGRRCFLFFPTPTRHTVVFPLFPSPSRVLEAVVLPSRLSSSSSSSSSGGRWEGKTKNRAGGGGWNIGGKTDRPPSPSPLFLRCSERTRPLASRCLTSPLSFSALHVAGRAFVQHDTNPTRWRNAESEEVRRRYKGGIPLHSQAVKEEDMKAQQEAVHAQRGSDMHWKGVHGMALAVMVFLLFLQFLPDYVDPVPSPVYVPYTEKEDPRVHSVGVCE